MQADYLHEPPLNDTTSAPAKARLLPSPIALDVKATYREPRV